MLWFRRGDQMTTDEDLPAGSEEEECVYVSSTEWYRARCNKIVRGDRLRCGMDLDGHAELIDLGEWHAHDPFPPLPEDGVPIYVRPPRGPMLSFRSDP